MITARKIILLAAINVIIMGYSSIGISWTTRPICDGKIMGANYDITTYRLNRCSIPVGSTREQDVTSSIEGWNDLRGVKTRFYSMGGSSSCYIEHGDGLHEIGYTLSSNIDGAQGINHLIMRECRSPYWSNDGRFLESDILIATDNTTGVRNCDEDTTYDLPARAVASHELGHTTGMDEEWIHPARMNTKTAQIIFCGPNQSDPLPDDINFAQIYHGNTTTGDDVVVSSYYRVGVDNIPTTTPGVLNVCPGNQVAYRYSVGNRGTSNLSGSKTIQVKTVLSTDTVINNNDIAVQYPTHTRNVGQFSVSPWFYLTVPNTVSYNTTYYIGVIADWNNTIPEWDETNNATYLAGKIRIKLQSQCP